MGYRVSPQLGFGLSAGRVQSPALRLIVEREEAIRAFQPLNHFQVVAQIQHPFPRSAEWDFAPFVERDQPYWLERSVAEAVALVSQLTIQSVEPEVPKYWKWQKPVTSWRIPEDCRPN